MNTENNTFATVLNCMDGRVQLSANKAVREIFGVQYVDTITEAGIVRFLNADSDTSETQVALTSIKISLEKHASKGIAVAAHYDCAGNPISESEQKQQLITAKNFLAEKFPETKIVALWLDSNWEAEIISE